MNRVTAEVRNPLLALPAAQAIIALPKPQREALAAILGELSAACRANAEVAWKRGKAPMAVYWRAAGIYARHLKHVVGAP